MPAEPSTGPEEVREQVARDTPAKRRRNVCVALSIAVLVVLLVQVPPDGLGAMAETLVIAVIIAAPYLVLSVTGAEVSAVAWWMTITGLVVSTGYGLVGVTRDALAILGSIFLVPLQLCVVAACG